VNVGGHGEHFLERERDLPQRKKPGSKPSETTNSPGL